VGTPSQKRFNRGEGEAVVNPKFQYAGYLIYNYLLLMTRLIAHHQW